jgi:hypothetical protein
MRVRARDYPSAWTTYPDYYADDSKEIQDALKLHLALDTDPLAQFRGFDRLKELAQKMEPQRRTACHYGLYDLPDIWIYPGMTVRRHLAFTGQIIDPVCRPRRTPPPGPRIVEERDLSLSLEVRAPKTLEDFERRFAECVTVDYRIDPKNALQNVAFLETTDRSYRATRGKIKQATFRRDQG